MMMLSKKPIISFHSSLKKIRESNKSDSVKNTVFLNEEVLKSQVAEYILKRRCLEDVVGHRFSEDVKESFLDCYNNMPVALDRDLNKVHMAALKKSYHCPYCMLSEPDSSDHYLPKDDFPEFSFYIYNLIPSCTNCNRRKGQRWVFNGVRLFVNPYFDDVSVRALDAHVSLKDESLRFYVVTTNVVFVSHIEKLDLVGRYEKVGGSVLHEVMGMFSQNPALYDQESFKDEMGKQYRVSKDVHGENYYKTVIYRRLSLDGHDLVV